MVRFDEEKQRENVKILRAKEEESLAQMLAGKYGIPYVNLLTDQLIEPEALRAIEEEAARDAHIVGFTLHGRKLSVASTKPGDDKTKSVIDGLVRKGFSVLIHLASEASLNKALDAYKNISTSKIMRAGVLNISEENILNYIQTIRSIGDSKKTIEEVLGSRDPYHVTMIIEAMLASALALDASDVHIEPGEDRVLLRFRLDGLLSDILDFDKKTFKQLVSRIKLLSGLKLNIQRNAQDGRFTISLGDKDVEIRTSILPGDNGESIVMRVLNPDAISVPLEELGIHSSILEIIKREIRRPNGMILNTGPTGSGKTTTLYAFLKHIKNPEIKIITIEDPIEYHLPGIVQTQATRAETKSEYILPGLLQTQASRTGLSFAEGLRSIVRQDPDVLMIGEIRDAETAEIAIQAALTGHLVFSTLHTNTAAATFSRLIDLKADSKTVGAALNVTMAQRLVRILCEKCKKEVPLEGEDRKLLEELTSELPEGIERPHIENHFVPVGCDACFEKGYKGRVGIFDIVLVDDELEDLLHEKENPSQREILAVSKKQGILNMKEDAALKILSGKTSLEEVRRVIDL